jgi:hypothetical protein
MSVGAALICADRRGDGRTESDTQENIRRLKYRWQQ